MNNFGETMRKERKKKEITIAQIAEKLKWSPAYISDMERGKRNPPAELSMTDIANSIGIDPWILIKARMKDFGSVSLNIYMESDKKKELAFLIAEMWNRLEEDHISCLMDAVNRIKQFR